MKLNDRQRAEFKKFLDKVECHGRTEGTAEQLAVAMPRLQRLRKELKMYEVRFPVGDMVGMLEYFRAKLENGHPSYATYDERATIKTIIGKLETEIKQRRKEKTKI